MIDARLFDDLAENLGKLLPPGVSDMKSDFEKNAKTVLQSTLNKMDLVTREEFDIQAAVLQKTRARLNALEARLNQLDGNQAVVTDAAHSGSGEIGGNADSGAADRRQDSTS